MNKLKDGSIICYIIGVGIFHAVSLFVIFFASIGLIVSRRIENVKKRTEIKNF